MFLLKILCNLLLFGKHITDNVQELSPHIGFHVFVVGWVEPDDVTLPLPSPCLWSRWSNIIEFVNISTVAQRLLIYGGCFIEDFLTRRNF